MPTLASGVTNQKALRVQVIPTWASGVSGAVYQPPPGARWREVVLVPALTCLAGVALEAVACPHQAPNRLLVPIDWVPTQLPMPIDLEGGH